MIELKPPSIKFLEIAKIWHQDEELNALTGFGRGKTGQIKAQALMDMFRSPPKGARMYAIWEEDTPVGYVAFTDIDPGNKTAELHITLPRMNQGRGIGPMALVAAVNKGFDQGLFRITFTPLASNKRAIEVAAKVGFKLEARTKFSVWTDDGPQHQAQMRVVKPEWTKDK